MQLEDVPVVKPIKLLMLKHIRSGGQNGADIGAIIAAKFSGKVCYGGIMPKGYRTLDGFKPEYAAEYNMDEHSSSSYVPRTHQNVKDADATIRLAVNLESSGEKCTLKAIQKYNKPYFDVHIKNIQIFALPEEIHPVTAAKWLWDNKIATLNVAGNSEESAPGIQFFVEKYVTAMLGAYFSRES